MNSKVTEIKTERLDIVLTPQEQTNFLQLLWDIDTIYHAQYTNCKDMKIVANLRNAMTDFKNRYIKDKVVCV